MYELRNALQTSNLSVRALELGALSLSAATGVVFKRSLAAMGALIDQARSEVRIRATVSHYAGR
jgi:hypothetical protein